MAFENTKKISFSFFQKRSYDEAFDESENDLIPKVSLQLNSFVRRCFSSSFKKQSSFARVNSRLLLIRHWYKRSISSIVFLLLIQPVNDVILFPQLVKSFCQVTISFQRKKFDVDEKLDQIIFFVHQNSAYKVTFFTHIRKIIRILSILPLAVRLFFQLTVDFFGLT